MKKYKYVIVSPQNKHGGVIVLHALCRYLSEQGEDAKIFYLDKGYNYKNDLLVWLYSNVYSVKSIFKAFFSKAPKTYMLDCKRKWLPFIDKKTIVIYPEITYGNFFKAKNVVRWLMYHNQIYKQEGEKTIGYDKNDLFFCYRDIFNDEKLNPSCRKLSLTYFDLDTYKKYNHDHRSGKCYIVRKGRERTDLPDEFDGPIIDNLSEEEKVKYFNSCEYCISYDTQTAYSQIAALCGCVSVVIPEEGKTRADYRESEEIGYGVAFGMSEQEIAYAKETAPLVELYYKKLNEENNRDTKNFIQECEKYFN